MTLNGVERRNSPYFAFLRNSTDFQADYITVVEDETYNVRKSFGPPTFWRVGDGPSIHFLEQPKNAEFKLQTASFMQTPNKNE